MLQELHQEQFNTEGHTDEPYNYQQYPEGTLQYGDQSLYAPIQSSVDANTEFAWEDSGDFSNDCGLFDEYDSSFATFG